MMKYQALFSRVLLAALLSLIPLETLDYKLLALRMKARPAPRSTLQTLIFYWPSELGDSWSSDGGLELESAIRALDGVQRDSIVLWDRRPERIASRNMSPEFLRQLRTESLYVGMLTNTNPESTISFRAAPTFLTPLERQGAYGVFPDPDGVLRHTLSEFSGIPSLAHLVARSQQRDLTEAPPRQHLLQLSGRSPRLCRMSGLNEAQKYEKAVESCPWIEKLNSAENLVILTRSDDLVSTVHGPMTSAEIFAHDFTTHLSGRWIREPSPSLRIWLLGLLVLLHVLGSTYLILQYPVLTSAGGLLIAGTFIHLILFQALFVGLDLYLPSANAILSIFVTYLIFSGYRLAIQENREWRGLKQAQYLKELDEMKTNFLSLVSHDLKTPIAKIQAVVERLRRDLQESSATIETRKDAIESLENSTKELRDYIQSVLSLSRIEAKGVILNLKSHDINRVAESVVRRLKPLAAQRKVRFVLELEPLFPVECDEDLIRQVLTNLVDNAIKVSPEGGVITLRSFEEEHQLVLEVVDQGPGISKDQLPLMFQKFHRFKGRKISSHSPRSSIRGSGLGLYLSKYFIELHKGKISLHSQLGVGTCFRMSLPLESLHPQPQETQPTRPERNPEL